MINTDQIITGNPYHINEVHQYVWMNDHVIAKRRGKIYLCKRWAKVGDNVHCLMMWAKASKLMGKGMITNISLRDTATEYNYIFAVKINGREWQLRDPLFVVKIIK